MTAIAFGSLRSCGVTTLVAGLAAVWPGERRPVLVEADPAGGTLAATTRLPPEPGLASLAAATRRGATPDLIWAHTQQLPSGVPVLVAPVSGEQAASAVAILTGLLSSLDSFDVEVLLDCGRLAASSPAMVVFASAPVRLVAARPRIADLHALAEWLRRDNVALTPTGLVLIGHGPYPAGEVAEALGVDVVAQVPWDSDTAEALPGMPANARRVSRTLLVRALRSLADNLAQPPEHELRPAAQASEATSVKPVGAPLAAAEPPAGLVPEVSP